MKKSGRALLLVLFALAALAVAAIAFWPWLQTLMPHPALVEAWLGYLLNDLRFAAWAPIALLLLLGLVELVWALNLGRKSGAQERQLKRLERLQEKELALFEHEVVQLQADRDALLAEVDRFGLLVRDEEERLWAEFEELQRASHIDLGDLATVQTVELPADLRGTWRHIISQVERIDMLTSLRLRQESSAADLEQRFDRLLQLGGACYHLGQYERALSHYQRALDLVPNDPGAIINHAVVNYALGRLPSALRGLDRALELDGNAWAYLYRGMVHERQGEKRQALEDYDRAIALNPADEEGYYRRGLLYAGLGEIENAVQDQSRVLELDEKHAAAFTARGVARATLGEAELALSDLNQGCALAPQVPKAFYHRGCVHHQLEMYDQALEDLGHAIELHPGFAPAFMARGDTHQALQQYQQAAADYGQAIELQPQSAQAYWSRGRARVAMEDHRAAIEDFDAALEIDSSLAAVLSDRGAAYNQLDEHGQAIRDLDRAIALDPGLPAAYYQRGLVYGRRGEYDLASRDLDKAVELDPSLRDEGLGVLDGQQE